MSVKRQQIPITSPCPITLDRSGVDASDRELFCVHCSKDVHLLSHMTEREARELMSRRAGEDICVSYAIGADGQIRFRPEPPLVPSSALVRAAPLRRGLSMAASIGAAAFLAACTPHGELENERGRDGSEAPREVETGQVKAEREPIEAPPPVEVVEGGLRAEPISPEPCDPKDLQVEGGLKAAPIDPPEPPLNAKPIIHSRGGVRAQPIEPQALGLDELP